VKVTPPPGPPGEPFERKRCGGCAADNHTVLRGAPPGALRKIGLTPNYPHMGLSSLGSRDSDRSSSCESVYGNLLFREILGPHLPATGAPPGIFLDEPSGELFHLYNAGACPGSVGCLRGSSMGGLSLCAHNPLVAVDEGGEVISTPPCFLSCGDASLIS
jgi:hypothetical protein